jgi:DNA-directed RNA polymerase subunit H (RpoH/RPB5)
MTVEEENEMMKRYNITEKTQLPDISRFDPVAQVIGIRPGQICEIKRPSKTAIFSLYYRVCM